MAAKKMRMSDSEGTKDLLKLIIEEIDAAIVLAEEAQLPTLVARLNDAKQRAEMEFSGEAAREN